MQSMLTERARRYIADAGHAFERAPVEVSTAVTLAVAFSYALEARGAAFRSWTELAITGVLIVAAAWTATLLHALGAWSARRRWIVTAGGAAAAALYALLVLDLERAAEGWRAAMIITAGVLWLACMPYFARRSIDEMRAVTGRVLLRTMGALLYATALFAGLALALGAINTLFELQLDGSIYGHVFGWIFFVLAPWIVVGGTTDYVQPHDGDVAGVVHRMSAFLVPPLLAIYCAILYAYAARIGITGEVPKNLVSPLVFAAGALTVLGLLLFDPRPGGSPAHRLLRAAPPLFVPLAALGVWTISLRVSQYGWTEFRLLRLLLLLAMGVLAVAGTVQLLQRRRFALHVVALGLAAVLVISAVGPWSVQSVARRSQQQRLDVALRAAGVEDAVVPAGDRNVPMALYEQIASGARYLVDHFGTGALPPALAAHVREADEVHNVAWRIGLRPIVETPTESEMRFGRMSHNGAIDIEGLNIRRVNVGPSRGEMRSGVVSGVQEGDVLRLRVDGQHLTVQLREFAAMLDSSRRPGTGELTPERARLDVVDDDGVPRGWLLVLEINVEVGPTLRLHRLDGLLLLLPDS